MRFASSPSFVRKPWIGVTIIAAALSIGLHAADRAAAKSPTAPFSAALTPAEFAGAGLTKLSPAELEELNRLIRAHESGELTRAREAARKAEADAARALHEAHVAAEKQAARAATEPPAAAGSAPARKESLLDRIRLKPGTQIDYDTLESELVGDFSGWRAGTVFTLANGQRWRVIQGDYESPRDSTRRRAWIKPGLLGTFFIEIEGIKGRAKVEFAGSTAARNAR